MIEKRNRQFRHRSKPVYLAMPMKTVLEQCSRSAGGQTGGLALRSKFASVETRTDAESIEQRQRVIVWPLIALLWILFLIAGIILWTRAGS